MIAMPKSGFGWRCAGAGWKRRIARVAWAKKPALPRKRKPLPTIVIPPKEKPPTFAEARKLLAEQGMAESAPTPVPAAAKPAPRQMRQAWSGKYDALTRPATAEP